MTCPDNLLIGYRRGALSDDDKARLESHLSGCATCRLSLQVGFDFDRVLDPVPGDDVIAARFARNLPVEAEPASARQRTGRARAVWAAVAAVAVIVGGGLAAARFAAWPFARGGTSTEARPGAAQPEPTRPARSAPAPEPQPVPAEQPAAAPPAGAAAAGSTAQRASSAAELFVQANASRHAGEAKRARALYRRLQQLYPRSPEVEVSHVSLGRVQLELGEPADALAQFERYLKQRPRGPLAEEALFGKASALERLGRSGDERRTWETLLATHPSSVYADRARARLERIP